MKTLARIGGGECATSQQGVAGSPMSYMLHGLGTLFDATGEAIMIESTHEQ